MVRITNAHASSLFSHVHLGPKSILQKINILIRPVGKSTHQEIKVKTSTESLIQQRNFKVGKRKVSLLKNLIQIFHALNVKKNFPISDSNFYTLTLHIHKTNCLIWI